ncbi:BQ2448_6928 [Microbotryum intermedium]|uniref:BQ2448_6928 protein n=1 Tax=Microbotryum intermedium TaxID=269621 RepID=A0A238FLV0_9BASI|nr:BQ2448_6928 [Microbotryum intermedium]
MSDVISVHGATLYETHGDKTTTRGFHSVLEGYKSKATNPVSTPAQKRVSRSESVRFKFQRAFESRMLLGKWNELIMSLGFHDLTHQLAEHMIMILEDAHRQSIDRPPTPLASDRFCGDQGDSNKLGSDRNNDGSSKMEEIDKLKQEYESCYGDKGRQKQIGMRLCQLGEQEWCVGPKEQYDA